MNMYLEAIRYMVELNPFKPLKECFNEQTRLCSLSQNHDLTPIMPGRNAILMQFNKS